MSSKHFSDYFIYLVVIVLCIVVNHTICAEEASIPRSLDLSIPAWRPLVQNPYQQHYYQNPAPKLITYAHLDPLHKDEIIEAAKINAQTLRKYNELAAQQPITSYSNPYPMYTQTPGPLAKTLSTNSYLNPSMLRQHQPSMSASNHMHALLPYPGKSASSLYATKLNFLGKPELSHQYHHHHNIGFHQNSIHQTIATTPKVAGFTKEQNGRVNFHYHHPSFGLSSIFDSTTKRIPMYASSVTPLSSAKNHPVMSKLQAHLALAAISQQQQQQQNQHKLNKLKIAQQHQQQNNRPSSSSSNEFSPPSQIISNYANYETATRVPSWHHGYQSSINNQGGNSNREESKNQHSVLPSVHPSIITPFLEQVQMKQKESSHQAEQKHTYQQSAESSDSGSYEVINDVFSQHLVPPPASPSTSKGSSKNRHKGKQHEKPSKFNLSMQSPLQDASRFNYNNVISTATPSSTSTTHYPHEYSKFRPHQYQHESVSGADKLNIFVNLNRSKENPYKQHKLLHPSYKKNPLPSSPHTFNQQQKPTHFLPTPYEASKESEEIKIDFEQQPHHSFFTIEDAVTPNFPDSLKQHDANQFNDEFEIITLRPQLRPTYASFTGSPSSTTQITPSTTAAYDVLPSSSQKPKGKLRRRKPKPHLQQQQQQQQQQSSQSSKKVVLKEVTSEEYSTTYRPPTAPGSRTRGNIKSSNSTGNTQESDLRTRNRINHPNRVRTRPNFSSPSATALSTASVDYDFTISPSIEAERKTEVSTTQTAIEGAKTTEHFIEQQQQQPDFNIKHRVRLRYKNKLNLKNVLESGVDFKQQTKLTTGDNQISDSENENVVVKQPSEEEVAPTIFTVATENPFNEIKSSLKLPNLKLRNEVLTTLPSAESTISTSTTSTTASSSEHENNDNNIFHKIVNRPRFSIKELKRKQFLTSSAAPSVSTTVLTSSTSTSTPKVDNQRFNRYRLNSNLNHRRRNETNESNEEGSEVVVPRKRYSSSTRFLSSTSTTESPLSHSSTTKRALPKRTYPVRNFTRASSHHNINADNVETTTSHKPSYISKNSSNRPSIRQRTQSHKRKEVEKNVIDNEHEESIKNVNFPSETTLPHEAALTSISTTTSSSTEMPVTRETSIMKIAKTPSSISSSSPQPSNSIKATTINSIEDTLASSTLSERNDSSDLLGSPSEHSQRITDLTVSANEDSSFKSASIGLLSCRIHNYFTISTDDPILPIQAFFPQIKTNESEGFTS